MTGTTSTAPSTRTAQEHITLDATDRGIVALRSRGLRAGVDIDLIGSAVEDSLRGPVGMRPASGHRP